MSKILKKTIFKSSKKNNKAKQGADDVENKMKEDFKNGRLSKSKERKTRIIGFRA